MNNEKEYEIWQDDMMVAGAGGVNALNEIKHYAAQYGQDGPIEVYEVTRRLVDLPTPPVLAAPANSAVLPAPFFYYESNEDGSVEWNEGCVCVDDVYTNAEYAKENETHGGKVYSEAQMRAYGQACAAAERAACAKMVEDQSLDSPAYIADCIRART